MAKFPALPLWTDAWVADTKHLSIYERGLYHDLLVLMWRTPNCSVPNDDDWLVKRLSAPANHLRTLISEFCHSDGNRIYQKRLLAEFNYLRQQSAKQSARAKSRWDKEKDTCRSDAASGIAPTPTPTPTPTPIKKERKVKNIYAHPDFERFWAAYPRHTGKPKAIEAFAKAIVKTSVDAMTAAIQWQAEGWHDPQYIPYPATWLNQERWADERTKPNGNGRHETLIERGRRLYDIAVDIEAAKAAGRAHSTAGSSQAGDNDLWLLSDCRQGK